MVTCSHTGETPDESAEAAGNGLPLAVLDSLWRDVGADGWETVHPLINISGQHYRACCVVLVVNWADQWRRLWVLLHPPLLGGEPLANKLESESAGDSSGSRHVVW